MTKKVRFQLDLSGGAEVLQNMASRTVTNSANSIRARASSISSKMTNDPPSYSVHTSIGEIVRGRRAIAVVRMDPVNSRQAYIGREALVKATDAGKIT